MLLVLLGTVVVGVGIGMGLFVRNLWLMSLLLLLVVVLLALVNDAVHCLGEAAGPRDLVGVVVASVWTPSSSSAAACATCRG